MTTFEELIGARGETVTINNEYVSDINSFSKQLEEATIQFITRNLVVSNTTYASVSLQQTGSVSFNIKDQITNLWRGSYDDYSTGNWNPNKDFKDIWNKKSIWKKVTESLEYGIDLGANIKVGKTILSTSSDPVINRDLITDTSVDTYYSTVDLTFSIKNLRDSLADIFKQTFQVKVYGVKLAPGSAENETLIHGVGFNYKDLPGDPNERKAALDDMRSNMEKAVAEKQYSSYEITEYADRTILRTVPFTTSQYETTLTINQIV